MRLLVYCFGLLTLAACGSSALESNVVFEDSDVEYQSMRSTTPTIEIIVDGESNTDWTLAPKANPDVFSIVCYPSQLRYIVYRSDIDQLAFEVSGDDRITFAVIGPTGAAAVNELRCLSPPNRYQGRYDLDRPTASDIQNDLSPILETYFDEAGPGALVGVWQGGEQVFSKAIGLSNVERKRNRLENDRFEIASLAKEFTAVSVMQLIVLGELGLDDTVSLYVPNLPWGHKVSIRHLLSHTSGLGNRTYSEGYSALMPFDRKEALREMSKTSLAFSPGSDYLYSNAGMTLLAIVMEEITGLSREVYIKKNILEPAGMNDTLFLWELTADEQEIFTAGYFQSAREINRLPVNRHPTASYGSGDLVSTLQDLRKWHVALKKHKLLPEKFFNKMIEPVRLESGAISERGLAFMIGNVDDETIIYNSGDLYTHTRHAFLVNHDLSIIVNVNVDIDGNFDIAGRVRDQIIGKLMNTEKMELYGTTINVTQDY